MSPRDKTRSKADVAVDAMSFEQAFQALADIVRRLEEESLPLEEALALFERAQALAARCGQQLDQAELKVRSLAPASAEDDSEGEAGAGDLPEEDEA
jgi:exodeoxyribonuclease VII small subunit